MGIQLVPVKPEEVPSRNPGGSSKWSALVEQFVASGQPAVRLDLNGDTTSVETVTTSLQIAVKRLDVPVIATRRKGKVFLLRKTDE